MLLGIALHAAMSFFGGVWPVHDIRQSSLLTILFAAVHGFRMPLFFLLSGFFTMLVFRRRGLGPLLRQRVARILVPLAVSAVTIVPLCEWLIDTVIHRERREPMVAAVVAGDIDGVKQGLAAGAAANARDRTFQRPLLMWAAMAGQTDVADMLCAAGADVNEADPAGNTPFHMAALCGREGVAALLLARGADPQATSVSGAIPLESLSRSPTMAAALVRMLGLPEARAPGIAAGREETRSLLEPVSAPPPSRGPTAAVLEWLACTYWTWLAADRFLVDLGPAGRPAVASAGPQRDREAVVGEFDARRKPGRHRGMVDVVRHVHEERAAGPYPRRHRQRLVDRKMRRVPLRPQAVEDQRVEAGEEGPGVGGNLVGVGAVGQITESEAEHAEGAMPERQRHDAGPQQVKRRRRDPLEGHLRQAASRGRQGLEGVVEGLADPLLHPLLAIHRQRSAGGETDRADVVEAIDMIDMVVGVEYGIDAAEPLAKQLRAQIGRGVDQERAPRQTEGDARAGPLVARIAPHADLTAAADHRHAHARAGAEKEQLPGEVATRMKNGAGRVHDRWNESVARHACVRLSPPPQPSPGSRRHTGRPAA
jgi:hypothetical protein